MALRARLHARVSNQAQGLLPHFWPESVIRTLHERRIHGQSLPRPNKANSRKVADFWLTNTAFFFANT